MAASPEIGTDLLLATCRDAIEPVLALLNARELNRVASVCTVRLEIVNHLKRTRQTAATTVIRDTLANFHAQPMLERVKGFFQNLDIEPNIVFMFYTVNISGKPYFELTSNALQKLLPKQCKFIGIGARGVVGTSVSGEITTENSPTIAFLCLPNYEGTHFSVGRDLCTMPECNVETAKHLSQLQTASNDSLLPCQLILTFTSLTVDENVRNLVMTKFVEYALVAGGNAKHILKEQPEKLKGEPILKYCTISGECVKVASILITYTMTKSDEAERKIKTLKEYNLNEKKSFSFMFVAGSVKQDFVIKLCQIFKELFQNTPILGVHFSKTLGFEFDNINVSEEAARKHKKARKDVLHRYGVTIVLVCIV